MSSIDLALLLLDLLAFIGYLVYPLTFFIPGEAAYYRLFPGYPGQAPFRDLYPTWSTHPD